MIPYVMLAPWHLIKRCRAKRYIVNHTHFIFPGGIISYILKRFTGLPYLITAHGSDVPHYNPNRFRLLHQLLRPLYARQALFHRDRVGFRFAALQRGNRSLRGSDFGGGKNCAGIQKSAASKHGGVYRSTRYAGSPIWVVGQFGCVAGCHLNVT